jgi:ferritin-like metal-binding protein YciE
MLADKVETPLEFVAHDLGVALTMEKTVHGLLLELRRKTRREALEQLFRRHAEETVEHIANLGRAFALLGAEPDEKPCLPIKAIQAQGKLKMKRTAGALMDDAIAGGVAQTEHYEVAVYEELIAFVEAMGRQDVARLLHHNLAHEQQMLDDVKQSTGAIARDTFGALP